MALAAPGCNESEEDLDLPEDYHRAAGALTSEPGPDDDFDPREDHPHGDDGDDDDDHHHRHCDHDDDDDHRHHHHRRKRGRRRNLFRTLDRLDGTKDGRIVVVALPPRVPRPLVSLLVAIDVDADGAVSRKEAAAAWLTPR